MDATRERDPGEFCWINILTAKPAEACAFFTAVLGWSYGDIPGLGYNIKVGGQNIGGLFDLEGPNTPPGTRAMIGVMVKVENADDTCARIAALGGRAQPAFDIMDAGRMAVCFDPNGAQFDIWQPKAMPGMDVDPMATGAPTWHETITSDPAKASVFYEKLFGWTPRKKSMELFEYTSYFIGDRPIAGLMPILPQMGNIPSHWGVYFAVPDTDAAVKAAEAAGGTVCIPPMDIPDVGRFAGLMSPQGVMFYVLTYLPGWNAYR